MRSLGCVDCVIAEAQRQIDRSLPVLSVTVNIPPLQPGNVEPAITVFMGDALCFDHLLARLRKKPKT